MSVCILSHEQVKQWEETGERPNCKFHHHTTYRQALLKIENDEAFPVEGIRSAVVIFNSVLRYSWQSRRSGGFSALQFCPIAGRKSPLGLCDAARKS